jgi:UPF0755 protein
MSRQSGTIALLFLVSCSGPQRTSNPIRVTIPRGASVTVVTDSLASRGVIHSPGWFRLYTKLVGRETTLQAGVYDFPSTWSIPRIVSALVKGQIARDRLVLPEGLMLKEVAEAVESQLGIPADSFLATAQNAELAREVGARHPTLEGYLYPNTYYARVGASALEVVRQMLTEFEERWKPEWNGRMDTLNLTRDEVVTLASIIEAEVHDHVDRFYVSSVYHNRLARGMRLEADPTVIYALGERRRLFNRDYQIQSPFNTYLIEALPPHAIGQPSAASIEAALYPRQSDFLFFVAGPGRKHIFSRTYREHQAAISQIRAREPATR